jgi:hypothetical protein
MGYNGISRRVLSFLFETAAAFDFTDILDV